MKTIKEIKKKIIELKKERKTLPQFSMFETDNYLLFDTMNRVLEDVIKNKRNEMFIREMLDNLSEEYEGNFPEENTSDKAKMDAYDWLLGNREDL